MGKPKVGGELVGIDGNWWELVREHLISLMRLMYSLVREEEGASSDIHQNDQIIIIGFLL